MCRARARGRLASAANHGSLITRRYRSSVCCSKPHFLPKVSPSSSVAQTAHCVRIILYMGKSLGGSRMDKRRPVTKAHSCRAAFTPARVASVLRDASSGH